MKEGCEQGWCREAGGVWLCETQHQQPMALLKASCLLVLLHLLLSLGCTGTAETEHRTKGTKPCRELLAASCPCLAPRAASTFTSPMGVSSFLLLLRPWGSSLILPSSRGEPSLFSSHLRCSPTKGPSRAAPMLALWFWVWLQALHTHCACLESTGGRYQWLPRRRDSPAVIPAAPSHHDS